MMGTMHKGCHFLSVFMGTLIIFLSRFTVGSEHSHSKPYIYVDQLSNVHRAKCHKWVTTK